MKLILSVVNGSVFFFIDIIYEVMFKKKIVVELMLYYILVGMFICMWKY